MCDCVRTTDEALEKRGSNGRIIVNLFGPPRCTIGLYKRNEKLRGAAGKLPVLMASYCPFCGEKYAEQTGSTEKHDAA